MYESNNFDNVAGFLHERYSYHLKCYRQFPALFFRKILISMKQFCDGQFAMKGASKRRKISFLATQRSDKAERRKFFGCGKQFDLFCSERLRNNIVTCLFKLNEAKRLIAYTIIRSMTFFPRTECRTRIWYQSKKKKDRIAKRTSLWNGSLQPGFGHLSRCTPETVGLRHILHSWLSILMTLWKQKHHSSTLKSSPISLFRTTFTVQHQLSKFSPL